MKIFKTLLLTVFLICTAYWGIRYYVNGSLDFSVFSTYFQDVSSITSTFEEPIEVSEKELGEGYHYYYSTLSPEEKELYLQLYVICRDLMDYTAVSINDTTTINRIMEFMLLDNPQLFYIESWKTQTAVFGSDTRYCVRAVSSMDSSEILVAQKSIDAYTKICLSHLNDQMSDYEKALFLYEYIILHTEYVTDAPHNQDLYSVVMGQSVCKGYTLAYQYLCNKLSIPCISITGRMEKEHAWNLIQINGEWCHVDCTSGDDITTEKDLVDHSWFGINDSMILRSHQMNDSVRFPACDSLRNNYYYRNDLYFTSLDYDKIYSLFAKGTCVAFQFSNEDLYQTFCRVIETENFMEHLDENRVSHISYTLNENTFTFIFRCE